jgi:DNA-binding NtrC family response regulator
MRTEKRLLRIPVILMTADQGIMVPSESFTAGALAFLLKPITVNNVQTILRLLGAEGEIAA